MIHTTNSFTSLQASEDTFIRELPLLLREHEGKWVAYQGIRRITIAETKCNAYAECYQRGLTDEEFLVRCIEPPQEELILGPEQQCG